jgi:membrane associated rhomboid family serine protease
VSIREDIRHQFSTGNVLMQLIYINAGVFVLLQVATAVLWLFGNGTFMNGVYGQLSLPADLYALLYRPWSLLTHMFVHRDFLHGIFNLLWLYFAGTLFLNFLSARQLLSTYILGGLSGAGLFIVAMNVFPAFTGMAGVAEAMGASAAILALLVAVAALRPDHMVYLVLIGGVRLKYVAMVLVLLDVVTMHNGNGGGHFGHLGGALFGFVYGARLRSGQDLSIDFLSPFRSMKKWMPFGKGPLHVAHSRPLSDEEFNHRRKVRQDEVDAILDKIKQSGYDSLSAREKDTLFRASNDA